MKIQVRARLVYGCTLVYPVNRAAETLANLVRKQTLDMFDLQRAAALGLEIELMPGAHWDPRYPYRAVLD